MITIPITHAVPLVNAFSSTQTPLYCISSNHIISRNTHIVWWTLASSTNTATMGKGKAKNVVVKMLSAAGTGFFYTTTKNPRNVTKKLSLRKYDPIVRQHVIFNETKIKKG